MSVDLHSGANLGAIISFVLVAILKIAWWIISDPRRLALWSIFGLFGLASSRRRGHSSAKEFAQTTTFEPFRIVKDTAGTLAAIVAFIAYWIVLLVTALVLKTWLHLFELAAIVAVLLLVFGKRARLPRALLGLRGMILHPAAWWTWGRYARAGSFEPGVLLDHGPTTVGERFVTSRRSDVADIDLEDLAAHSHARDVRARRAATNANLQTFDFVYLDALREVIAAPSIYELVMADDGSPRSTYAPIPWGVDEDGATVYVDLPGEFHAHGIALASSRGGKTRWAWGVCAQHVARGGILVVLDGKDGLSFDAFSMLSQCLVVGADEAPSSGGASIADAIRAMELQEARDAAADDLVRDLVATASDRAVLQRGIIALGWAYQEQKRRNGILREISRAHGTTYDTIRGALKDGVWPHDEPHPESILVVVDEAPWWTLSVECREFSQTIRSMLDTIASKGASAGIGLLLLTQRATITDSTLPARARDNVKACRILFGTPPTPSAAETLFGNYDIGAAAMQLTAPEPGRAACTLAGSPVPIAARAWLHDSAWLAAALGYAADRHGLRPPSTPGEGPAGAPSPPTSPGPPEGGLPVVYEMPPVGAPPSTEASQARPKRKYPSGSAKRARRNANAATATAAGNAHVSDPDSSGDA